MTDSQTGGQCAPEDTRAAEAKPGHPPGPGRGDAPGAAVRWLRARAGSEFTRQVSGTLLTRVVLLGLGIVMGAVAARIMKPEGRGLLATAEAVAAIGVQFGLLGLHSANTHFVARDRSRAAALVGNTLLIAVGLGGAIAAGAWLVFAARPDVAPVTGLLLVLALAAIPVRMCVQLFQSLLIGVQEVHAVNAIDIGSCLLGTALVLPFLVVGLITPEIALGLAVISAVAAAGAMGLRLRRYTAGAPVGVDLALLGQSLRYGGKLYVACVLMYLVLRVDVLMLRYLLDPGAAEEQVGYYAVSVAMGDLVCLVPTIVGTLLFPRLSAEPDPAARWRATRRAAGMVAVLAGVTGGALALAAGPLVRLLYGEAFAPAAPGFAWLMPGVVFLSVNVTFMNYFAADGVPPVTVLSPAVAAVLNVAANWVVIPHWGFLGAAVTSSACYALMLTISLYYFFVVRRPPGRPGG